MKTMVRIFKIVKGKRKYFRSIVLPASPLKVWKALDNGCWDVLGIDIRELRAIRKRKGGRR